MNLNPKAYKILILEDDERLGHLLEEVLQDEGFVVNRCVRSDQALALARSEDYDLMVADIRMEGLDGLAALSQIQSHQPQVDGLVITGYADDQQAKRASRLGLGGILSKPFELDLFLQRVHEILSERTDRLHKKAESQALLANTRWLHQQLAQFLQSRTQSRYNLNRLAKSVRYLSTNLGMSEPKVARLSGAALYFACSELKEPSPNPLSISPPPEFETWKIQLGEWWNGKGPRGLRGHEILLEVRVLVIALAFSLNKLDEQNPDEKWPGRFDPELLPLLEHIEDDVEEPDEPTSQEGQVPLLSLGRTLLSGGDYLHAEKALKEVVKLETDSRSGVEALRLLCKLYQRLGQRDEAKKLAWRLPEVAAAVGPSVGAQALQQSAEIFLELGQPESAITMLESAEEQFGRLRLSDRADECYLLRRIALGSQLQRDRDLEAIQNLMAPKHRGQLLVLLPQLLPRLFESQPEESEFVTLVGRLLVAFPYACARALEAVSAPARSFVHEIIKELSPRLSGELGSALESSSDQVIRTTAKTLAEVESAPSVAVVTLKSLGDFRVYVGDRLIPEKAWRTKKSRFLFGRLAEAYPSACSEDVLQEEFWPGDAEKGRRSLYTATSTIRSVLRKHGLDEKNPSILKESASLRLDPELNLEHDLLRVREAFKNGKQHLKEEQEVDQALACFREIVLLVDGAFLPDCYQDWALRVRDEIEEIFLQSCLYLIEAANQRGDHREVIEYAQQALSIDPCHQNACCQLMEALNEMGRPEEALRQHKKCAEALWREFELAPQIEIERQKVRAEISLGGR